MGEIGRELWIGSSTGEYRRFHEGNSVVIVSIIEHLWDRVSDHKYVDMFVSVKCDGCGEMIALPKTEFLDRRYWDGFDTKTGKSTGGQELIFKASGTCPKCGSKLEAEFRIGKKFVPGDDGEYKTVYSVSVFPERGCTIISVKDFKELIVVEPVISDENSKIE